MPAPPAWATARAWRRIRRASRRSAASTSSIRRSASCSPRRCPTAIAACLTSVQHDLFDLGGELSIPGYAAITDAHVARLEAAVERFNADLAPLKEFILPGGTRAAALAHVARTVCRRAERALVRMAATEAVSDASRRYLNRLSDLLFVLARALNRAAGTPDVLWRKDRSAAPR